MPTPTPTPPIRAFDSAPIRVAIRAAHLANANVVGIVGQNVFADIDAIGNPTIYTVITLPSDLPMNTMTSTGAEIIAQITTVCLGYASDADLMKFYTRQTMLDVPWSIPGFDLLDVRRGQTLDRATVEQGGVRYYRGDHFPLKVRKQ